MRERVTLRLKLGSRSERFDIELHAAHGGDLSHFVTIRVHSACRLKFLSAAVCTSHIIAQIAASQDGAREFIHGCPQHKYVEFMRTSNGFVEVHELTRKSTKDLPSWEQVRQEQSVSANGDAMWHHSCSDWANQLNRAEYMKSGIEENLK